MLKNVIFWSKVEQKRSPALVRAEFTEKVQKQFWIWSGFGSFLAPFLHFLEDVFLMFFGARFIRVFFACGAQSGPEMDPKEDSFGSCFQKKWENRKVRFDCTGAYGLHVSPRPGAPKATQNYSKKQVDSTNLLFQGKIGKWTKNDPPRGAVWA